MLGMKGPQGGDSTPVRSLSGEVKPRTIWAYWAQGHENMPDFFKMCVGTWQRLNPHWDVRIVQKSTVFEYLSEAELPNTFMKMTSHQTASDAVRLALLSRYGGVWMDVNILIRTSLDDLCWSSISTGQKSACVFFHPFYGLEEMGGEDFVESWFLATLPHNPFFIRWRDLFCELFHDRLDIHGLMTHDLYQDISLEGFHRLNQQFSGAGHDFREYLAIHAMCHRLIETDPQARNQWRVEFLRINAAETAFRVQIAAEAAGLAPAQVLLIEDPRADELVKGIPLIKFTTPHYGPLLFLQKSQIADRAHLLGRLLDPPVANPRVSSRISAAASLAPRRLQGRRAIATVGIAAASTFCGMALRTACRGIASSRAMPAAKFQHAEQWQMARPTCPLNSILSLPVFAAWRCTTAACPRLVFVTR